MDQDIAEIRAELKKLHDLGQENNKMLRTLKRYLYINSFFSILKWFVILAATLGTLYFIQPYVNQVVNTYDTFTGAKLDFSHFMGK